MVAKIAKKDIICWVPAEKDAWKPPEKLTVSEWADKYRVIPERGNAEPGKWRTDRTPYLRKIMDCFTDPSIERITFISGTQIGKTEAINNMLGYVIDQDPGAAMIVLPDEKIARKASKQKFQPTILESPQLVKHLTKKEDDFSILEYCLDRMNVSLVWAGSPGKLAMVPIKYLFMDEVDKYPEFSGKEANPIKLAIERTRTYTYNKKIVITSTPTTETKNIIPFYELSNKCLYYLPCPHCGHYQNLQFGQIRWPKGKDGKSDKDKILIDKLAYYECENCEKGIYDHHKQKMLDNGVWCPEGNEIDIDGNVVGKSRKTNHWGFRLNSLYSPWLTFSEIAHEFLTSKSSIKNLMNFVNSWLAEPWKEKAVSIQVDRLRKNISSYPEGLIPNNGLVLTAGCDVQQDHMYLVIRAWGIGEESWLIRNIRVESFLDLEAVLFMTEYLKVNGEKMKIRCSAIDANYRQDEVYEFCRKWRNCAVPIVGKDHLAGLSYRAKILDRDLTGKAILGGLVLYDIATSMYKDKISRFVYSQSSDLSQWHLFQGVSEAYLNQFCAEEKVRRLNKKTGREEMKWELKKQGTANHFFDCEVYDAFAADLCRVPFLRHQNKPIVHKPKVPVGNKYFNPDEYSIWGNNR